VAYESLGYALQRQNRLEEALQAYESAYEISPSPTVKRVMEVVADNLAIHRENVAMEEEAERLAREQIKAEEEYREELRKREEWEKKRDE
jgi:tetratricopeptide (TPR) repeat protein